MKWEVLGVVVVCGCVPTPIEVAPPRLSTFGLAEAMAESQRPEGPARTLESVSLGYVGDAPLAGGIMADSPPPDDMQAAEEAEEELAPPFFIARRGTIRIGMKRRRHAQ
jgi:hypothetical protein